MADNDYFDILPSPDPTKVVFWVRVSTKDFLPSKMPTRGTTTYREFSMPVGFRMSENDYGSYVFTQMTQGPKGYLLFWFGPPDPADGAAIEPFETITKFKPHSWPTILLGLNAIPDSSFPRFGYTIVNGQKTLVNGPNYYIRTTQVDGGEYGTLFAIERFQSPRKFDIVRYRQAITDTVQFDIPGKSGAIPSCLHDRLDLEDSSTATQTLAGTSRGLPGGVVAGHQFPATNVTTWQRYVVDCDQQQVNGMWLMERIWANPPPLPPAKSRPV